MSSSAAPQEKPNVIFILVDDMGWADSSVYGSTYYESPALERLAQSSVRFTDAYSASPLCSPARASLLSGQYPARHGMTTAWGHTALRDDPEYQEKGVPRTSRYLLPTSKRYLDPEQYTLAEAFQDAGYRTGFIGKWHMGLDEKFWPDKQGFEHSFHGAPDAGPPSYFSPYRFQRGNVTNGPDGEYITDRATDEAIAFMEEKSDKPFFLCLWHWGVHGPWQGKEELIEYYKNRKDPTGRHQSPTMAAMLRSVDDSLADILDYLEESGQADNTIIVFTSDNGGKDDRSVPGESVPITSNEPLRSGKGTVFQGGSRVPLLISWPGVIDDAQVSTEPVTGVDMYPTLLEMCNIGLPEQQTLDGVSLAPLLQGGGIDREAIYCYFPENFGERSPAGAWVRMGDWVLVEVFYQTDLWPEQYELYNLAEDSGEYHNLAVEEPERVRKMAAMLREHYMSPPGVRPKPNPDFSPELLPVDGWIGATRNDSLSLSGDGAVELKGSGISTRNLPRVTGPLKVSFRVRSGSAGQGRFYWSDRSDWVFNRERSTEFSVEGDSDWQTCEIPFEVSAELIGIRIDFPRSKETVEIDDILLSRENGEVLDRWAFDGKRARPTTWMVERWPYNFQSYE
ncbi:sulfatase [Ruficoccus amylovorans]|uniref:Sulfatase n=1 Tax=Ruficoccus amylovorans TaxID=1804625 RepID=A0A842HAE1_9BACT|nr:sulfatase [Ruficoccus amylovorans]MBC2593463.1 sulfatase [Ruficoccus amylovorans]